MTPEEAFFEVHDGLPQQAPGSRATTLRALALTGLSGPLNVADFGCGPGPATLTLASALPEARFTAVDLHRPFIEDLKTRAERAGVADRIDARVADMAASGIAPGTLDLIWCEGAIYNLGPARALPLWRPLLRSGGRLVFSDAIWLGAARPQAARTFWQAYPQMTDHRGMSATIAGAGFRVIGDFVLPASDWAAYYDPITTRIAELRDGADATLSAVLDEEAAEAALFRDHGDSYGYRVYVTEPAP